MESIQIESTLKTQKQVGRIPFQSIFEMRFSRNGDFNAKQQQDGFCVGNFAFALCSRFNNSVLKQKEESDYSMADIHLHYWRWKTRIPCIHLILSATQIRVSRWYKFGFKNDHRMTGKHKNQKAASGKIFEADFFSFQQNFLPKYDH